MPLPDICVEDRASCLNEWPTLRLQQQDNETVQVTLRDHNGHAYPLNSTEHAVYLLTKQMYRSSFLDMVVECQIVEGDDGIVSVTVDEADTLMPGVFLGEFVVFGISCVDSGSSSCGNSSSGIAAAEDVIPAPVLHRFPAYVEVQINIQNLDSSHTLGSLTIAELRMGIRDKCSVDNFLLDHVEFSDTEIAWAIRRPLDLWNDHPPHVARYTPSTFPYRYFWLNGAVGELLTTAGLNYERNDLKYAAANLSVDDKGKSGFYMKAGQAMKQEYFQWMLREKKVINMSKMYGTTNLRAFGSRYPHRGGMGYGGW